MLVLRDVVSLSAVAAADRVVRTIAAIRRQCCDGGVEPAVAGAEPTDTLALIEPAAFVFHVRVNNVENVFLEKPAPGVWRVQVAAHRIGWDQHRGTTAWDQDFALVVAGVERDPVAPKPPPK